MPFRLWERIQDWVLLFGLLALSVALLMTRNQPAVRGLRSASLELVSVVESRFAWVGGFFRALDENETLRRQNIEFSSEVARSREAQRENERLRRLLEMADTSRFELRPARIVAMDINQAYNYVTIDVGSEDSVKVDMAVVDENGIVGKVILVSEHYARVMPYNNPNFRVPATILPIGSTGVVRWDPDHRHRLVMDYVSRTERVLPGQLVVTSGFSGIFPPGYSVGYVDSTATQTGKNEMQIFLYPASPIDRAEYVFVVLAQPDPERLALENRALAR
ncbi:MAG TPA: rod shape-determining protein MreC [Rhodothermales bacterium]